jgi:UDP-glucose 4-epimerase
MKPAVPDSARRLLVTGATGKVGRQFIERILQSPDHRSTTVGALCHNRHLEPGPRLEIVQGSISDRSVVSNAMQGVTHVLHLATCKETPEDVMDVTRRGLFWLLEECRRSSSFQQIILIGGDAALGHFFYPHAIPITEQQTHSAYPGCYALSKVLDEVMLEQYFIQYDLNGCCLRAPWILEKDDFRYSLSFGENVFGGPRWCDLVSAERAAEYVKTGAVPVMLDPNDHPVKRNFVHVSDLVEAIVLAIDHPKAASKVSISAWTSQWTIAKWPSTWLKRGAYPPSRYSLPIGQPGWTTPRQSFCWAGGPASASSA